MPVLANGYSVIIKQKIGSTNKPIYPYTRSTNVFVADGRDLDTYMSEEFEPAGSGHYVPDYSGETVSNLRFLRNDNSWATIQDASTSQKGVVQLYDGADSTSTALAPTANALKGVATNLATLDSVAAKTAWIGASTDVGTGVHGIAPLGTDGIIPTSYLPSYVSDVFEVRLAKSAGSDVYDEAYDSSDNPVTPKANAIYVWCIGSGADNNTYRWSGSQFVEISKSLVIGTTTGTAFDGALGNAVYTWYQSMGNVENKSSATIRGELTTTDVRNALGLSVAGSDATAVYATSTVDGIMSMAYAGKLDNCMETAISDTTPSFTNGLWIEIVDDETPTP